MPKATKRKIRRSDWEANQALVQETYVRLMAEKKRAPTSREVAAETGLHFTRVAEHVRAFDWKKFTNRSNLAILVPAVVGRLAEKILLGALTDVRAREVKLFLEIMVGYRSPSDNDLPKGEMPDVIITLPDNGRGAAAPPKGNDV